MIRSISMTNDNFLITWLMRGEAPWNFVWSTINSIVKINNEKEKKESRRTRIFQREKRRQITAEGGQKKKSNKTNLFNLGTKEPEFIHWRRHIHTRDTQKIGKFSNRNDRIWDSIGNNCPRKFNAVQIPVQSITNERIDALNTTIDS